LFSKPADALVPAVPGRQGLATAAVVA